jgi:hypothetical protein
MQYEVGTVCCVAASPVPIRRLHHHSWFRGSVPSAPLACEPGLLHLSLISMGAPSSAGIERRLRDCSVLTVVLRQ